MEFSVVIGENSADIGVKVVRGHLQRELTPSVQPPFLFWRRGPFWNTYIFKGLYSAMQVSQEQMLLS